MRAQTASRAKKAKEIPTPPSSVTPSTPSSLSSEDKELAALWNSHMNTGSEPDDGRFTNFENMLIDDETSSWLLTQSGDEEKKGR